MKIHLLLLALFCFQIGYSQTNVSGIISTDQTWTKANSPYIVVDTVTVDLNITLTIEPGVDVQFPTTGYINVQKGILIAEGTKTDSITFTGDTKVVYRSAIKIFKPAKAVSLKYCKVTLFFIGIELINGTTAFDSLIIKNSNLTINQIAVKALKASGSLLIDSSSFNNNLGIAIWLSSAVDKYIRNSNFTANYGSIGISDTIAKVKRDSILSCAFLANTAYGIDGLSNSYVNNCLFKYNEIGSFSNKVLGNNFYVNCTIDSNYDSGVFSLSKDTLMNCLFSNSTKLALLIDPNSSYIANNIFRQNTSVLQGAYGDSNSNTITNNQFVYNNSVGAIWGGRFTKNIVENNDSGLNVQHYKNALGIINCNKFCNNGKYNIILLRKFYTKIDTNRANKVILSNNYWCTTDSVLIDESILDENNDTSYISSIFMPIDIVKCYEGGTSNIANSKESSESIRIFPNPASNSINIEGIEANAKLSIYSIDGRLQYHLSNPSKNENISIINLNSGIYFIKINNLNGKDVIAKFIKS